MEMVKYENSVITQKYTQVEHEKDFKFNAPHHFVVKSVENGTVVGEVNFQEGPIAECGVNGVCNEDLIAMVIARLDGFQNSPYACEDNAVARTCFISGLAVLRNRTNKRAAKGIEGTSAIDKAPVLTDPDSSIGFLNNKIDSSVCMLQAIETIKEKMQEIGYSLLEREPLFLEMAKDATVIVISDSGYKLGSEPNHDIDAKIVFKAEGASDEYVKGMFDEAGKLEDIVRSIIPVQEPKDQGTWRIEIAEATPVK